MKRNKLRIQFQALKDTHRFRRWRDDALKSFDYRCFWCAKKFLLTDYGLFVVCHYEIDHIVPISLGGDNDFSNLTISCPDCNRMKSNKTLEEWLGVDVC